MRKLVAAMMAQRDAKGRFKRGPMSEEHRAAISRGQVARHLRNRQPPPAGQQYKRCTQCNRIKRVPEDFPMRRRKLVSGYTIYPAGECRACNAKRSAAWRARLRADPERAKAAYARWNAKRDQEARRAYNRDYQRIQRVLQGVTPRGPWKKYRHELERQRGRLVYPDLFMEWLGWNKVQLTETERRRIDMVRSGAQRRLSRSTIDAVMSRVGSQDQFHIFDALGWPPTALAKQLDKAA